MKLTYSYITALLLTFGFSQHTASQSRQGPLILVLLLFCALFSGYYHNNQQSEKLCAAVLQRQPDGIACRMHHYHTAAVLIKTAAAIG